MMDGTGSERGNDHQRRERERTVGVFGARAQRTRPSTPAHATTSGSVSESGELEVGRAKGTVFLSTIFEGVR